MSFIQQYFSDSIKICEQIDKKSIESVVDLIYETKKVNGRMFILGIGGGAGHASHAVNDFRKIVNIEAYSPLDNVSELTARINDEGWETCLSNWLVQSRLRKEDLIFIFSVGGGNVEHRLSLNLVDAMKFAKKVGAKVSGIVGRDGGETAKLADACIIIPDVNKEITTALTESFQALIWHLIVSHPKLYSSKMRWESI